MGEILHTEPIEIELQIRADDERVVWGRVVPFGQQITIGGRPESFAPGSISIEQRADSVILFYQHDHLKQQAPIGRGLTIEHRADGVYMGFKVAQTPKGDEILQLAREGVLRSFSPGFIEQSRTPAGVITRALLREVSLTPFPAYDRAAVLAVREIGGHMPDEITPAEGTETQPATEPVVEYRADPALTEAVEDLRVRMERMQTAFDAEGTGRAARVDVPEPHEWFAAELRSSLFNDHQLRNRLTERYQRIYEQYRAGDLDELQTRALDDVTGVFPEPSPAVDASGLVQQAFMGAQLVNVLDTRRPMFANVGRIEMPESGYAGIPRVSQHTVVAARGAQKSEIPSQSMIITLDDYAAGWLAGGVDIALELLRTASLDALAIVWNDLVGQYAIATEHDASHGLVVKIDAGITGATYTGAVLPVNTYAAFIAAVLAAADSVEDATGSPATDLFLTRALFNSVVGLIDPQAFSARGSFDGATVGVTAQSFVLPGGITVHKVKGLDQAILTNDEALKVADSGPEQVTATNVALMGRDLGLLGRTLVVPRIPAGIVYFEAAP